MVQDAGERGHFIGTASGLPYWPLDPRVEDVRIFDIAVHTSRECRFGGALRPDLPGIYSVAQHLVLCSHNAPPGFELEALLHDAHEAYTRDMVKPFKVMLEDYQAFEELSERCVREAFGLPPKISPEVKAVDRRMFATEVRDLTPKWKGETPWNHMPEPYGFKITPWTPKRARDAFLARFEELRQ